MARLWKWIHCINLNFTACWKIIDQILLAMPVELYQEERPNALMMLVLLMMTMMVMMMMMMIIVRMVFNLIRIVMPEVLRFGEVFVLKK